MRAKGSFTVEAAFIVPIILFILLFLIQEGIRLYGETVKIAEEQNIWETSQPAEQFRQIEGLKKLLSENQEEEEWK